MPAAAVDARRRSAPRAAASPARTRPRPGPRAPSKVEATRRIHLRPRLAMALAAILALAVLGVALVTGGRGERAFDMARTSAADAARAAAGAPDLATGLLDRLAWRVDEIHLQGASPAAQADILAAANVRPGQSLTRMDLDAVRARVESVGWVERARVMRLLPDHLVISIVQRPLTALWQHDGRTVVIASNGAPIPVVDPARFPSLPLVVGAGANTAAGPMLALLHGHARLFARTSALVRVDDRRWDVELTGGRRVLLPEDAVGPALDRLDRLDAGSRLLDLDFERIDLRDPQMIILRPRMTAAAAPSGGK